MDTASDSREKVMSKVKYPFTVFNHRLGDSSNYIFSVNPNLDFFFLVERGSKKKPLIIASEKIDVYGFKYVELNSMTIKKYNLSETPGVKEIKIQNNNISIIAE